MSRRERHEKKPGDGAQRKSSERTIVCEMVKNVTFSLLVGSHWARERERGRVGGGQIYKANPPYKSVHLRSGLITLNSSHQSVCVHGMETAIIIRRSK